MELIIFVIAAMAFVAAVKKVGKATEDKREESPATQFGCFLLFAIGIIALTILL